MIHKYALPSADIAGTATSVVASTSGSPATSDEDAEYPGINMVAPTNTGHLNLPSRPAKLTTLSGSWLITFPSSVTLVGAALIYHNLDAGLDVSLDPTAGTPIDFTIPAAWENGWWPSPWMEFAAQSATTWTLSINAANSVAPQVGRLLLYESGGIQTFSTDVRFGEVEAEDQGQIEHVTEAGVETLYELWGPRRSFSGDLGLLDSEATELQTLYRTARNRIQPWLLIPDAAVNDAWLVRFDNTNWERTRSNPNFNSFPFRVTELSRGLPWP